MKQYQNQNTRRFLRLAALSVSALLLLSACGDEDNGNQNSNENGNTQTELSVDAQASQYFSDYDLDAKYETVNATVTMSDTAATISEGGTGVAAAGTVVTVNAPGTYVFSGECADGQIVVNVTKEDKVHLVFNGLTLSNKTTAPVNGISADKVTITLADGTKNTLTDASEADSVADRPNACLFVQDDLSINGGGTLTVNGNFNNGIATKDDLRIVSGTITVKALNNGIKGNDSIAVKDGTVEVNSDDDGIKSENDIDEGKGFVNIYGGTIHVTCGDDGIQAPVSVTVAAGSVTINAGGQMVNAPESSIADGCLSR